MGNSQGGQRRMNAKASKELDEVLLRALDNCAHCELKEKDRALLTEAFKFIDTEMTEALKILHSKNMSVVQTMFIAGSILDYVFKTYPSLGGAGANLVTNIYNEIPKHKGVMHS